MYVRTREGLGQGVIPYTRGLWSSYIGESEPFPTAACPGYVPGEIEKSRSQQGHLLADVIPHPRGLLIADFGVDWPDIKDSTKKEKRLQVWLDAAKSDLYSIFRIYGYTDCVGKNEKKNVDLRGKRAQRVYGLLDKDLQSRVTFVGAARAGEYIADNKTKEGRAKNRGVIIELSRLPEQIIEIQGKAPRIPCTGPGCKPPPPRPPIPCTGPGCQLPPPPRPPYGPPVYHPPGPVVPWPGNAPNQLPARDTGHSPWVWDALKLAASGLGLTISAGLMALNSDILGKAIGVAQFALGIKGLEARALIGLAGEMVAESILENLLGSPGHVFNLNEIRKNFPLIDLITPTESPSVKTFGILTERDPDKVVSGLLRGFKQGTGRDWAPGSRYRKLTQAAQALFENRNRREIPAGALSEAVRLAKSVADVEAHIKKTFTQYVPDDYVVPLRRRVTELVAREIGVEVTINGKYLAGRKMTTADTVLIQSNLERVRSLGLTSSDLRILVEVGADLRRVGKGAKKL
jgi:hypothetical protein